MKNAITITIASGVVGLGALFLGYHAGTARTSQDISEAPVQMASTQTANTAPDRSAIEAIVKDYLISNPEIMLDVQNALETKQAAAARTGQRAAITANADKLFSSPMDAVFGNPDGDVTVVEFFDYNCGYCKHALPDMDALLKSDPNVRFVMKEFPILGPDSVKAHMVAKAFQSLMPGKYLEFHRALLGQQGRATEQTAIDTAVKLGADETQLREKMQAPEIATAFQDNYQIANALNITGTPSYIIGEEVVPGAIGLDGLAQKIAEQRDANG
ncbi:disulfide bond formation protein DsbA [Phyllobacterium phragmitis]|uniref:Disulfide bond formation protein DsbA n=1 Tax=Phyllobacterium phragmitis TaxID=2670329 RepID=A0A2S9IND0_9HYPH|nr:DsbA family protein [Phyllobacterium phragmitis]PRD42036.1 disulfide bond formation protein DsbA [Phyllobacterium phragmitis]